MMETLAQTVLQMGMTNYLPLRSYAVCTFPLRTLYRCKFCYAFYTSAVYVWCGAVLGRCGLMW